MAGEPTWQPQTYMYRSLRCVQGQAFLQQSKPRIYVFISVITNFRSLFVRFRDNGLATCKTYLYLKVSFARCESISSTPSPIPAKIWRCSLWSRSIVLGSAEREKVRLISRQIIFTEFQPIWSRYLNVTDRRTDNLPCQHHDRRSFAR